MTQRFMTRMSGSTLHVDLPAEARQLGTYQALSGTALAGGLLGLLSPLALVNAVLWSVPLAGIGCSLIALRQTRDRQVSGRGIAIFGLLMCAFFFACAATKFISSQRFRMQHAQQLADLWVELVRAGRLSEAHQWTILAGQRVERWDLVDAYYRENPDRDKERKKLFHSPGLRELAEWGSDCQVRMVNAVQVRNDSTHHEYHFDYQVVRDAQVVPIRLAAVRRRYTDIGMVTWNIDFVRDEPEPSTQSAR
jgi:hypothetical protein